MTHPFFSVIIPTYNGAHVISQSVNSVLSQSFNDFEVVVLDDGSKDHTKAVIEAIADTRIRYHYQANAGVCAARNAGAALASGQYLIFLDNDDSMSDDALIAYHKTISENSAELVHGTVRILYADGREKIMHSHDPFNQGQYTTRGTQLSGSFCLKRERFLQTGGYDTNMTYGENTEFFWRLDELKLRTFTIPQVTVQVNQDLGSRTGKINTNIIHSVSYVLEKHKEFLRNNRHVRWLYYNVLSVAYARSGKKISAIKFLMRAIAVHPLRIKSYFRLLLIPFR